MTKPAYILIDPPVTAYSSVESIRAWLDELSKKPDTDEVKEAINAANELLRERLAHDSIFFNP
jgi:hypothetical protein